MKSSALAVVAVMMLTALISGAALIRMDSSAPEQATSFIGTTPDASGIETPAPTF